MDTDVDIPEIFQSTLPLRGATRQIRRVLPVEQFQSTLPLRGATRCRGKAGRGAEISIHAPLAGSDARRCIPTDFPSNFNPRSPCGERREEVAAISQRLEFQSTLPLRGATHRACSCAPSFLISIHAPLAGSDLTRRLDTAVRQFQSTLPLRGATAKMSKLQGVRLEEIVRFVV